MTFFENLFLEELPADFQTKATKPAKKAGNDFMDDFQVTYSKSKYTLMLESELATIPEGVVWFVDTEIYINYFLAIFKHLDSGKCVVFEIDSEEAFDTFDVPKLAWMMKRFLLIGFNSREFDMVILNLALKGFGTAELKRAANQIILSQLRRYQMEQFYKFECVPCNEIDLIEVAPLQGSLKLYAGRLHCKRMQDLPIEHTAKLTAEQMEQVKDYCFADVDNTELLFNSLKDQLSLRYRMSNNYGVDVRSKSDAQIAEAVIGTELARMTGRKPTRRTIGTPPFYYIAPKEIAYNLPVLQDALRVICDATFEVNENNAIELPKSIAALDIRIGQCAYRVGIGGLHSTEERIAHKATNDYLLIDRDVVSYYPAIILNQRLFPKHLGTAFLDVYRGIVEKRVEAKRSGDKVTADSLKICVNGSFGKLGNSYSILYSPELMIQVTISGQLYLLMLIEMVEQQGIRVLSANTDGVLIGCPAAMLPSLQGAVSLWEQLTGFETEETRYKAVYAANVNNYLAVKEDGTTKTKGAYSEKGSGGNTVLSKNPENLICNDAVSAFVSVGKPIEETIRECKDVRRFVTIRNVKGGATKSGKYLGKCVRWYYSTEMQGEMKYVTSGNKVPNSDGARPLMELPENTSELPSDLDYDRYIAIATQILYEIGAIEAPPENMNFVGTLFEL